MILKKISKRIKKITLQYFAKKVPVYVPVLKSDLLKNRIAIITGGSSGIGLSIAESFLNSGAKVIIIGRDEKKLKLASEKLISINNGEFVNKVKYLSMDVADFENLENRYNDLLKLYENEKIDILVNSAGIASKCDFAETSKEEYDDVLSINLKATYFLSQIFSDYLKKNKITGNILNIASSSSLRPAITPYMLSKWGIRGLTLGLAKKLISDGIIVNGLAPGPTATPMLLDKKTNYLNNDLNPSGRYVTSSEIGNMAVFLVSDMGKMIVGDIIYMTGGAGLITFDDIDY